MKPLCPGLGRRRLKPEIKQNFIQDDQAADREDVLRDISVLHKEVEDDKPGEQMGGNQYELVRDILEEMLDNLWDDIDTVDKLSENEDPCAPPRSEIEKDQQFENVEVTAQIQSDVLEDDLQDQMVNTINYVEREENPVAKQLQKTSEKLFGF